MLRKAKVEFIVSKNDKYILPLRRSINTNTYSCNIPRYGFVKCPMHTLNIQKLQHASKIGMISLYTRKLSTLSSNWSSLIQVDDQVQDALDNNRPIVALESTIITHGMSYPDNLKLLQRINTILQNKHVTPALIAIKNGTCHIGISDKDDIEDLVLSGQEGRATKCSTREISLLLSKHHSTETERQHNNNTSLSTSTNQWGATTVASTMKIASMVGISTFVTGGIGGVHRDGHNTLDISTDLVELSRTPVIVVSAGIKSILDIPRTLEVLETYGVPVIAYQTYDFPAFFSPKSGVKAPERMDDVNEIASAYNVAKQLRLQHGFLVAVPNIDPAGIHIENAIQAALVEAKNNNITGRDITPFILKYVAMKTQGDSLRSNVALVARNTMVGADIAIAVAKLQQQQMSDTFPTISSRGSSNSNEKENLKGRNEEQPKSRVIVMGGIVLDIIARPASDDQLLTLKTSNPAICNESDGGVGCNIAETLCRLGSIPLLFSAVGNDTRGISILRRLNEDCGILSLDSTVQTIDSANTATYLAILNEDRDLHVACADMDVFQYITPPSIATLQHAEYLILDANAPKNILEKVAIDAVQSNVKVFFDPTSVPKARALCSSNSFMSCLSYAAPNLDELYAMIGVDTSIDTTVPSNDYDEEYIQSHIQPIAATVVRRMHPYEAHIILTCGEKGVLLASRVNRSDDVTFERFHVSTSNNLVVQNATGAGDTLSGAFIHALLQGKSISDAVRFGMEAAVMSLQCANTAISPLLSSKGIIR